MDTQNTTPLRSTSNALDSACESITNVLDALYNSECPQKVYHWIERLAEDDMRATIFKRALQHTEAHYGSYPKVNLKSDVTPMWFSNSAETRIVYPSVEEMSKHPRYEEIAKEAHAAANSYSSAVNTIGNIFHRNATHTPMFKRKEVGADEIEYLAIMLTVLHSIIKK